MCHLQRLRNNRKLISVWGNVKCRRRMDRDDTTRFDFFFESSYITGTGPAQDTGLRPIVYGMRTLQFSHSESRKISIGGDYFC